MTGDKKENNLWAREIEGVTPLKGEGKRPRPHHTPKPQARRPKSAHTSPGPKGPRHQEPFDPALYKNIASGKAALDGKLDLHGMTEAHAHQHLVIMIERAWSQGRRRLLVITGRGRDGGSPLRAALPKWLSAPNLSPYVSSFDYAGKRHGGDGAFYVLLRKNRGDV
jgi:DNA-nicking Smr family endonuclease